MKTRIYRYLVVASVLVASLATSGILLAQNEPGPQPDVQIALPSGEGY